MGKLTKVVSVAMAALVLGGCGSAVEEAHKAVSAQLQFPSTAKYTNVRSTAQGNVCGQVRGKDAAGAYTPYQSYVAIKTENGYQAVIDRDGQNQIVRAACGLPLTDESATEDGAAQSAEAGWEVLIADSSMGALSDMTSRLVEHGFMASVVNRGGKNQVYLGPYNTKAEAEEAKAKLMASQGIESTVEPHKPTQ